MNYHIILKKESCNSILIQIVPDFVKNVLIPKFVKYVNLVGS